VDLAPDLQIMGVIRGNREANKSGERKTSENYRCLIPGNGHGKAGSTEASRRQTSFRTKHLRGGGGDIRWYREREKNLSVVVLWS